MLSAINLVFFPVKTKRLRLLLKIFELSVSHFMVSIKKGEEDLLDLKEYEKIPKVTFIIRVLCFIYNAIFYMIRDFDVEIFYVFAFLVIMIRLGLIFKRKKIVIQKMYEIMNSLYIDVLTNSCDIFKFQSRNKKKSSVNDIMFYGSLSELVIK